MIFIRRRRGSASSVRVVKYWNKLPASVVTASFVDIFKNRLEQVWTQILPPSKPAALSLCRFQRRVFIDWGCNQGPKVGSPTNKSAWLQLFCRHEVLQYRNGLHCQKTTTDCHAWVKTMHKKVKNLSIGGE